MSKQGHSQEQIDRKLQSIESWKDTITRYKKQVQEINDNIVSYRQINNLNVMESKRDLLRNNVQIAEHNIRILESELMIDKIRKKNYKIKAQHDNAEVLDVTV
jgi:ppGpp synthetase/RelA/SpoT-type nucleotidyltranferase